MVDCCDELICDFVKVKFGFCCYVGGEVDELLVDVLFELCIDVDYLCDYLYKYLELEVYFVESYKVEVELC